MSRTPVHPGEILAEELEERKMSGLALAHELHVPPNRIYLLLSGKRGMTADTALRLSQWFGTSAEFWMNLQALYELRLAEEKAGKQIRQSVRRCPVSTGAL